MQSTTVRDRQEYTNDRGDKAVRYVINPKETMIARAKQQQIQGSLCLLDMEGTGAPGRPAQAV